MSTHSEFELAGIEYVGLPGIPHETQDAVLRYVQYGDKIIRVRILSNSTDHCLLLTINNGDTVAVKSGFGSGYRGSGPWAFSYIIRLLEVHGAEIEEYSVERDVIDRLDQSALTRNDLDALDRIKPERARHWMAYVFEEHYEELTGGTLWRELPPVVPFAFIDPRIADLALSFWDAADEKLLTGYRRLEDIVRKRTGLPEYGAKLFAQAFDKELGRLTWEDVVGGEHAGRAQLFTGAFMAYRNRRAHRETKDYSHRLLAELLLLNHLFLLEREATGTNGSQDQRP
jgi:hypothetical protein